VAKELGVSPGLLYAWRKQYVLRAAPNGGIGIGPRPRTLEEAEEDIRELRAEVIRLREREMVLKKSLGILSETPGSGMPRSRL
jgi:transposase-like protein